MNDEATIFLVDDDPAALRTLTALVKVVFPRIEAFSSAAAFLAAYRQQPGCLVLDVAMPNMNGLELYRKLIQDKVTLPVVFVTGHGNVAMAVEAMQMGAVNFLEKPVQEQALWDSIRKALELDAQNRRRRVRRQRAEERLARLTPGERQVLNSILEGKMNKEIATEVYLSDKTVKNYVSNILEKLTLRRRSEAAAFIARKRAQQG